MKRTLFISLLLFTAFLPKANASVIASQTSIVNTISNAGSQKDWASAPFTVTATTTITASTTIQGYFSTPGGTFVNMIYDICANTTNSCYDETNGALRMYEASLGSSSVLPLGWHSGGLSASSGGDLVPGTQYFIVMHEENPFGGGNVGMGSAGTSSLAFILSDESTFATTTSSLLINTNDPIQGSSQQINWTATNADTYDHIIWDLQRTSSPGATLFMASSSLPLQNGIFTGTLNLSLSGYATYKIRGKLYDTVNATSTDWSAYYNFIVQPGFQATSSTSTVLSSLKTTTCDSLDIECHFKNVFIFYFVPSQDSIDYLVSVKDTIFNKPPFGYFTLMQEDLQGINSTTTGAFAIVIPAYLQDTVFTPLKTGLSVVIYFSIVVFLFIRFKNIII